MKILLGILSHDVNEGIISYWYKWLICVMTFVFMCFMCETQTEWLGLGGNFNPNSEVFQMWNLMGRRPYYYDPYLQEPFTIPYEWLFIFAMLMFVTGNYVSQDLNGFGLSLIVQSRNRGVWWTSKIIWSVIINVLFWGSLWLVEFVFAVNNNAYYNDDGFGVFVGQYFRELPKDAYNKLYLMIYLVPFLVGVAQVIIQNLLTIVINSEFSSVLICIVMISSSYYSSGFMIHEYSMIVRYMEDITHPEYIPLDIDNGIIYLCMCILIFSIVGYALIVRKNLINSVKER